MPQSLEYREGRLVARLGTLAFDGLDQSGFLSANVSTRTHEDAQIELPARTKNVVPKQLVFVAVVDFPVARLPGVFVFMANVEDSGSGASRKSGDNHAFNEKMRKMLHDEAILYRSRFTFIRVADDILLISWAVADRLPLSADRKPCPAHAS